MYNSGRRRVFEWGVALSDFCAGSGLHDEIQLRSAAGCRYHRRIIREAKLQSKRSVRSSWVERLDHIGCVKCPTSGKTQEHGSLEGTLIQNWHIPVHLAAGRRQGGIRGSGRSDGRKTPEAEQNAYNNYQNFLFQEHGVEAETNSKPGDLPKQYSIFGAKEVLNFLWELRRSGPYQQTFQTCQKGS